ncbi:putative chitinase [Hoeflea phototrophica DFL-43]|uniref:Putative chitinase n=1 Tax=Hoeflea phototrophica (strain DSM 17068 / NCIMB 14078 / DFL-43) TaxID=411684 RepID=A9DC71_HOEPD|nr:M15 family metallopeptidase [Hoeflea phototrophica]EDQ32369.2 putative chitinase [Hoeflea phototrophica DFL-43]
MSSLSEAMRTAWAEYECRPERMIKIDFGPDTIRVAPPTVKAWLALEHVLASHGYDIRIEDTDSYNCRDMKSGKAKSLHAYGIALDINWKTNPYIDHAGQRKPRFSDNVTQSGRAQDVRLGRADTDMTRGMVDAALAIKTVAGKQVFGWGGDWRTIKDAMHFQIEVTPEDLGEGIDWSTVPGAEISTGSHDNDTAASHGEQENAKMELPKSFFDTVRASLFGGTLSQSAVDNLNIITGYWLEHYRGRPLNQLAYILATVKAEVGANMRPVREGFAKDDADARKKLAHRPYAKSDGPFGHAYYGRGYVQLTHLENYKTQSDKLGIDLVKFPDKALETPIALQILAGGMLAGDFNGKGFGLGHYVNETKQDFVGARRTVNIQDRADEIAGYAELFLAALRLANLDAIGASVPADSPTPVPAPGTVAQGWTGGELAETNALLRLVIARLDAAAGITQPSAVTVAPAAVPKQPSQAAMALLQQLGLGSVPPERLAALLTELEKAGVIVPGQNLTPVNRALGETIGKALNGKKTVIGIAGLLVSIFLPQLAPLTTFLTNITPADGALVVPATDGTAQIAVESLQNKLMPLAAIIAGWGGLGKIDKWMHKPTINTLAELLAAARK